MGGIEVGNGLPTLATAEIVDNCVRKAGFELEASYDANRGVHDDNEIAWYETLKGKFSIEGFRMTRPGRILTHAFVTFLEIIRIAPSGTSKISSILNATAVDLVEAGEKEIFTPSYFLCQKTIKCIRRKKDEYTTREKANKIKKINKSI